jgi:putative transposase
VHRSSFSYWRKHRYNIKPEKIAQYSEVKRIHELSNGSAGARTIATISTTEGILAMSRYVAGKRMHELGLRSCQMPVHRYKPTGDEHLNIPNTLNRDFTMDAPNEVWCGDVTYIWTGN